MNPYEGVMTSTAFDYCLVQVTIKIVTSKIIQFGKDKGLIEYGVLFTNSKGVDEVFTVKTPFSGVAIPKEFNTSWNINAELRSDTYLDKVFKEPRRTQMYFYVEEFEWLAEFSPSKIEQSLPF